MNKKIIIGLLITSMMVLGAIGYLIFQTIELNNNIAMVTSGNAIAWQARAVNEENFHTQLELWEYVNDPNKERIEAFEMHAEVMNEKLKSLEMLAYNENGVIYSEGVDDMQRIINKWHKAIENWQMLLVSVKKYEEAAIENKIVEGENFVNNPDVYEKLVDMREETFKNEKIFDEMNFNGEMEMFIVSQGEYMDKIKLSTEKSLSLGQRVIWAMAILYLILLVFIALWLENIIRLVKKKSENICKV